MPLPLTNTTEHVCFFRHALALDECRVKFIPEYLDYSAPDMRSTSSSDAIGTSSDVCCPYSWTESNYNILQMKYDNGGSTTSAKVWSRMRHLLLSLPYHQSQPVTAGLPRTKEVWFAGTHSDMYGYFLIFGRRDWCIAPSVAAVTRGTTNWTIQVSL